jgi:hypothetical protein
MASSTQEIGRMLGKMASEQNALANDITPQEEFPQYVLSNQEAITITGSVTLTKYLFATDAFILDHPKYGELDSSVYALDNGYSGSPTALYTTDF